MIDNYPSGYNEQPTLDDLLQPYETRIKALEDFIKKARDEAYSDNHFGNLIHVVPEWFMMDDIFMIEAIGTACDIGFEDDMGESIMMDATISDDTFRMALDKAMKQQKIKSKERAKRIGELLVCTNVYERDAIIDKVEKEAADYEQSKKTPTIPSEFTEQCQFVLWFRHTYPGVILMSIRNGGIRAESERQGQMLEGLYVGASDLFCPEFDLWIEFKKTKGYVWKPEQKQFKEDIEKIGHTYVLAIGCEDGKAKVKPIIERKLREIECGNLLDK